MTFSYTLTVWDCREALRLHRIQKVSRRVSFLAIYRIVPVLAVIGLVLLGRMAQSRALCRVGCC